MSEIERHERVRADWLLAHEASWHLSDRRMANELRRQAAQKDRAAAGAAESSHHEARIKPLHTRFVIAGEDPGEVVARGLLMYAVIIPALTLTIGPALALSQGVYLAATERELRRKAVPKRRQWFLAAGVLGLAGIVAGVLSHRFYPDLLRVATVRFYPEQTLDVAWPQVGALYGWLQVTLAMALVAWQIRRHGWPGVTVAGEAQLPVLPTAPAFPPVPRAEPTSSDLPAFPPVPEVHDVPDVPETPDLDDAPFAFPFDLPDDEDPVFLDEDPNDTNSPTHEGDAA